MALPAAAFTRLSHSTGGVAAVCLPAGLAR